MGSHVADLLAEQGHEPVLLDALVPTAHDGATPPEYVASHRFVAGDVTDAELLRELLGDVDAVCHQAAIVGHGLDPADAPANAWHNDYGTAVLLAAMHTTDVRRLVLASSMVVYGEGAYSCPAHGPTSPAPRRADDLAAGVFDPRCPACDDVLTPGLVDEDAPLLPRSTYAATKLATEHLATAWARDTPYAGVASLFRSALRRGEAPMVFEDGNQRRDFVHVRDVARANLLALLIEAPPGELVPLNVCSAARTPSASWPAPVAVRNQ